MYGLETPKDRSGRTDRIEEEDFLDIILCRICSLRASTQLKARLLTALHTVFLICWWRLMVESFYLFGDLFLLFLIVIVS